MKEIMQHLFELLKLQLANPFISGGFMLMITGSIIAFARNLPMRLWGHLRDQFIVQVSVMNNDPLFDWITLWLNDHPYSKKTRRLLATTVANYEAGNSAYGGECVPQASTHCDDEIKRPKLILSPSKGQHFFVYNGTLLWLSRGDEGNPTSTDGNKVNSNSFRFRQETYSLRIFGRSQSLLRQLLEEVIERAVAFQAKKISAFVGVYSSWRRLRTFAPRKMESVILPEGVADTILQKLKDFIADRAWYQEMGIPYHLGMLFHGTPGSGKTSIIGALAGELKMNLYILSLAGEDMNDERFACLLSEIPPNSFMVLEDVDAAFAVRKRKTEEGQPTQTAGLTLTGILNALDGFMASEGSIVLMTTNHRELLDPALIRPGRVDFEVPFTTATQDQLRRLYARFFPNCNGDAKIWAMTMEGRTMAEAQQDLLRLKQNPEAKPVAMELTAQV
jgi:BCS1 N terminal/ATPase family associated with various cellular activities (AAA)